MERKTRALHLILRFILISFIVVGIFAVLYFSTIRINRYSIMTFHVIPRFIFAISIGFLMGLFFSKDVIIKHIRYRHAKKSIDWNHLFVLLDLMLIVILFLTVWDITRIFLLIDPPFDAFLLLPILIGYFLPRIWKEEAE